MRLIYLQRIATNVLQGALRVIHVGGTTSARLSGSSGAGGGAG